MQQILHNMDSTQLKHMLVNLNHFPKYQGKKNETSLFNHTGEFYSYAMCVGDQNIFPNPASKDWICVPKPRLWCNLMWFCQTIFEKVETHIKRRVPPDVCKLKFGPKHWLSLRTNGNKIQASLDSFWYGLGCSHGYQWPWGCHFPLHV